MKVINGSKTLSTHPGECRRTPVGITPVLVAHARVVHSSRGGNRPQGTGLDHHHRRIVVVATINTIVDENFHLRTERNENTCLFTRVQP